MFKKSKQTPPSRSRRTAQPAQRSAVFSYYASRAPRPDTPGRDIARRQESEVAEGLPRSARAVGTIWQRVAYWSLLFVVVACSLWSLRVSPEAAIVVTGAPDSQVTLRNTATYARAAATAFDSFWAGNKLTINTNRIASTLQKEFPELRTVTVSLPLFGNTPTVYLQPVEPRLLLATQSNALYVVDSMGRAIMNARQATGLDALNVPVVQDQGVVDTQLGAVVLPRSAVAFISEIAYQLKTKGVTVSSYILLPQASELQVRLEGVNYYIKFNVHGKAREAAGTYLALRDKLAADRKVPKEYIDARVESRAYYK